MLLVATFNTMRHAVLASALMAGLFIAPMSVQAATKVASGNFHSEQPAIPRASANRTNALNTTYERKYEKVLALLRSDSRLMSDIKSAAQKFKIDPIHIVGAIVGEHTYNVDALDRAQTYYVKALAYIKNDIRFAYDGEGIGEFIARPQFEPCADLKSSRSLWTCRENIWESKFRNKTVDGTKFPNDRFSAVFFQPFFAGQTFGIGQLNPLTALMMTDRVKKVMGGKALDHEDGKNVYQTIMDPKTTIPYIAATLAQAIEDYKKYADFDISDNPGLTATLYNTGRSDERARALAAKNKGKTEKTPPVENYYGWLINDRIDELRSLL